MRFKWELWLFAERIQAGLQGHNCSWIAHKNDRWMQTCTVSIDSHWIRPQKQKWLRDWNNFSCCMACDPILIDSTDSKVMWGSASSGGSSAREINATCCENVHRDHPNSVTATKGQESDSHEPQPVDSLRNPCNTYRFYFTDLWIQSLSPCPH